MKSPCSRTSRKAASSREISGLYSAPTSTSGIVCTRRHSSGGHPSVDQIRERRDDACPDRVLDVAKVVLEPLVARPEGVADPDEGEGPESRPDQGQAQERRKRHLEDAGRNRDERAEHGDHRPEEHSGPVPALEPGVGPVEPVRRHVQPATPMLEQLPAAEAPDEPTDEAAGEIADRGRDCDSHVRPAPTPTWEPKTETPVAPEKTPAATAPPTSATSSLPAGKTAPSASRPNTA